MSPAFPPNHVVLDSVSVLVKYDRVFSEHSFMVPDATKLLHVENDKGNETVRNMCGTMRFLKKMKEKARLD